MQSPFCVRERERERVQNLWKKEKKKSLSRTILTKNKQTKKEPSRLEHSIQVQCGKKMFQFMKKKKRVVRRMPHASLRTRCKMQGISFQVVHSRCNAREEGGGEREKKGRGKTDKEG